MTPIQAAPVEAAVTRLTALAAKREAGVQDDAKHSRRSGQPWDADRLASERVFAIVPSISLADLRTLLAAHAETRSKLGLAVKALERLGSSEAFDTSRMLDENRDAELVARMDYARQTLALVGEGSR